MMGFKTVTSVLLVAVLLVVLPVWNPLIGKAWAPTAVELIVALEWNLKKQECVVVGIQGPSDKTLPAIQPGDACDKAFTTINALQGTSIRQMGAFKNGNELLLVFGIVGPSM
jgi:hypothetical protein